MQRTKSNAGLLQRSKSNAGLLQRTSSGHHHHHHTPSDSAVVVRAPTPPVDSLDDIRERQRAVDARFARCVPIFEAPAEPGLFPVANVAKLLRAMHVSFEPSSSSNADTAGTADGTTVTAVSPSRVRMPVADERFVRKVLDGVHAGQLEVIPFRVDPFAPPGKGVVPCVKLAALRELLYRCCVPSCMLPSASGLAINGGTGPSTSLQPPPVRPENDDHDNIVRAFRAIDVDGHGTVEVAYLLKVLTQLGDPSATRSLDLEALLNGAADPKTRLIPYEAWARLLSGTACAPAAARPASSSSPVPAAATVVSGDGSGGCAATTLSEEDSVTVPLHPPPAPTMVGAAPRS